EALKRLAAAGGTVILCGPTGILDGTGAKSGQFTAQFGYRQELGKPTRQPGFPENIWFTAPPATLRNQREWTQLAPGLLYHPGRLQEKDAPGFLEMLPAPPAATAPGWFLRRHRDQAGDLLYHGFAADFEVGFNEAVEALRDPDAPWGNRIIDRAMPRNAASQLELPAGTTPAELFTPLATSSGKLEEKDGRLQVTLPPECYYFIVRVPQSA
ncbi:MAG TPA: hypothetical protein PKY10_14350, partial [Lentisphaeria bacterium]|nr:hypothetical protein [Lentisphaeria bacterium]